MDIRHAVGVKVGIPDAKLAALPSWERSLEFSDRARAALQFATEILELTFIVGYQTFASKFAKAFQPAPQGFATAPLGQETLS